jgi:GDPmannose 4,6-dehydratase
VVGGHVGSLGAQPGHLRVRSVGILFNHESPRRGETFVTRKITRAAARIALGLQDTLYLGNLEAKRDWGHAKDYVEAMWMMLNTPNTLPDDYVIATGETHTVREFLELVFGFYKLDVSKHVKIDQRYFRPSEVDLLIGDSTKARQKLGWKPKYDFQSLAMDMAKSDYNLEVNKLPLGFKDFEDWING